MEIISESIQYVLSFKVYVMLPIMMFILCMVVRMKLAEAVKNSVILGVGFLGIFMVFDFFVGKMGPAIEDIVARTGSNMVVLDVGWPPFAAATWTFTLVPLLLILIIGVNAIMLHFHWTDTINIDIWNYWHFIFAGQLIYYVTDNYIFSILGTLILMIVTLKLADWSANDVEEMSKIPGISISTLTAVAYYPIALFLNAILSKIPKIKDIKANPEHIQKHLGLLGEPMFIGLGMGVFIGISAGYSVKEIADLAMSVAGVVYILPKMAGILGEGLIPISNGAKAFILEKFPKLRKAHMGMDLAVIVGTPAGIATGILMMPIAVGFALVLPGISFIPLGDLPNLIPFAAMFVVVSRGNVFRAVVMMTPVIIAKLYMANYYSELLTHVVVDNHITINNYSGNITSFIDGGNLLRSILVQAFDGQIWALVMAFVALLLIVFTYRHNKGLENINKKNKAI